MSRGNSKLELDFVVWMMISLVISNQLYQLVDQDYLKKLTLSDWRFLESLSNRLGPFIGFWTLLLLWFLIMISKTKDYLNPFRSRIPNFNHLLFKSCNSQIHIFNSRLEFFYIWYSHGQIFEFFINIFNRKWCWIWSEIVKDAICTI